MFGLLVGVRNRVATKTLRNLDGASERYLPGSPVPKGSMGSQGSWMWCRTATCRGELNSSVWTDIFLLFFFFFWCEIGICRRMQSLPAVLCADSDHVELLNTSTHLSAAMWWWWKGPLEGQSEGAVSLKSVENDCCSCAYGCVNRAS